MFVERCGGADAGFYTQRAGAADGDAVFDDSDADPGAAQRDALLAGYRDAHSARAFCHSDVHDDGCGDCDGNPHGNRHRADADDNRHADAQRRGADRHRYTHRDAFAAARYRHADCDAFPNGHALRAADEYGCPADADQRTAFSDQHAAATAHQYAAAAADQHTPPVTDADQHPPPIADTDQHHDDLRAGLQQRL